MPNRLPSPAATQPPETSWEKDSSFRGQKPKGYEDSTTRENLLAEVFSWVWKAKKKKKKGKNGCELKTKQNKKTTKKDKGGAGDLAQW